MVTPAQKAVIGSMLLEEKCVPRILSELSPEDFTDPQCRILFLAARQLYTAAKPVDPVTVLECAKADGGEGLYDLVKTCMEETPTVENLGEYIPLLRQEARSIQAQSLGLQLTGTVAPDQIRDLVAQLDALMVDRPGVKVTDMETILLDFYARQKEAPDYLPWGIPAMEDRLKITDGKFVILAGYPSDGKTAMALNAAWAQSKQKRVGFFSLETDDATIGDRLVARIALIAMGRIKDRQLSQEDYDAIGGLSKDFVAHQLEIVDAVGMTAPDIISYARYRRYDVIYIDYLQLIRPTGGRNRTEEVSGISIALHNGARAARITVVALSQLSLPEKVNGKTPAPRMRNLRDSGQLEQDADAIMLLYREKPDDPDSRRVLTLEKNKEGELATMYLAFDGATQSFRRHLNQEPPPKRKEPEYKQVEFEDLPGKDPELPFEEGL